MTEKIFYADLGAAINYQVVCFLEKDQNLCTLLANGEVSVDVSPLQTQGYCVTIEVLDEGRKRGILQSLVDSILIIENLLSIYPIREIHVVTRTGGFNPLIWKTGYLEIFQPAPQNINY